MEPPTSARMRISGRHSFRPWLFLATTVGWTWTFWWSAAWSGRSWSDPLTFALFALGGIGPLLSAAMLLRVCGRREDELDFWRRLLDVRRSICCWPPMLLSCRRRRWDPMCTFTAWRAGPAEGC